ALFCGRFSPHVGLETTGEHRSEPSALLLDITGCARCFGGEEKLLMEMLSAVSKRGFYAQAAAAPTLGAAWALAHFGRFERPSGTGRFLSVAGTEVDAALRDLPAAALRLAPETVAWLSKLGLQPMDDLFQQPRASLPSRFGAELIQRIDQALGSEAETFTPLLPPAEFHAAHAIETPVAELPLLYPLLEKLTAALCRDLRKAARGVRELECWLYHEISDPVGVHVSLFQPSASPKHLMELLKVRLEDAFQLRIGTAGRGDAETRGRGDIRNVEERGVVGITLRVTQSESLSTEQLALFRRAQMVSANLSLLLDRLRTQLGAENVRQARIVEHTLPEFCIEWRAADGHVAGDHPSPRPRVAASPRPSFLLATPTPIRVHWGDQADGPDSIDLPERREHVVAMRGPERLEGGWWLKGGGARRDYFLVETSSGARHWIFLDLHSGEWFLHGSFD
ncbi:MAG TPA: DNA polymerase Y family protein, partial [Planctomycetota bacterium]|nr:DNA polymerase Y family protein [Planctomycetota bacterium]